MSEGTEQKKQNRILNFISAHPFGVLVAFFGALASIMALGPAYFPWWTAPKRALLYCISPTRTQIIQATKVSDIAVTYKGLPLTGNVTAAQIAVWNDGREPIRGEDILTPIVLLTSTNVSILEVSILKTNRAASAFRLLTDSDNLAVGRLGMDWKILQKNDGALIQVLYAGTPDQPIELSGEIVGQDSPRRVKSGGISWLLITVSSLVFLAMFLSVTVRILRMEFKGKSNFFNAFVPIALGNGFIWLSLWFFKLWLSSQAHHSPFGF